MSTNNNLNRGLFHIFGCLVFPVAALFLPRVVLLSSLGAVTFIFLSFELLRLKVLTVNRWFLFYFKPLLREEERTRLTGASYVLISSLIAFLAFPRDVAIVALSFLAVGDALGTIIGKSLGRRKLWGKTLEGDLACFIACLVTGFVFHYAGLSVSLPAILVGSVGAALMEALPLPINDNLTIPLFAGVVMTVMLL